MLRTQLLLENLSRFRLDTISRFHRHVADHYLRAVYVQAGEHRLVFTYDGARVVWPLRLSLVALLAVLAALWTGRRSR